MISWILIIMVSSADSRGGISTTQVGGFTSRESCLFQADFLQKTYSLDKSHFSDPIIHAACIKVQ